MQRQKLSGVFSRSFSRRHALVLAGFLVVFALFTANFLKAFAAPPGSPYNPGDTLDPSCAPGTTNCTVTPPMPAILSNNQYIRQLNASGAAINLLGVDNINNTRLYSGGSSLFINPDQNFPTFLNYNNSSAVQVGNGVLSTNFYVASGTVGIGTTTPSNPLTVQGNANITGALTVGSCVGCGGGGGLSTSTPITAGYFPYWTSAGGGLAGTSTIYYSGGNIGVGTATPSLFKLQVAGSAGPDSTNVYDLGSSNNRWRKLYVGDNTGGVDINDTFSNSLVLRATAGGGYLSSSLSIINQLGASNGTSSFQVKNSSSTNLFTVLDTGNVGLGTATPTDLLQIASSTTLGLSITNTGAGVTGRLFNDGNLHVSGGGNLWIDGGQIYINGGNTNRVSIGNSSPGGTLDIKGAGTTNGLTLTTQDSNGVHRFGVQDNGNTGIGTSSPAYMLDVYGSARLGSATSTPVIFKGYAQSALVPFTDNTYALGAPGYRWSNLYVATTTVGDLVFGNNFRFVEQYASPQALVLKNQNGVEVSRTDENGVITAHELCLDDVCINATQLRALLKYLGQ